MNKQDLKEYAVIFGLAAAVGAYSVIGIDPLEEEKKTIETSVKKRAGELDAQFKGIRRIIGEDYVGSCLTGNQAKDYAEGKGHMDALSDKQKLLVKLYTARRETAMGRYLNISQKDYNTVTCVQDQRMAGYLGIYADWVNVATVNLGRINEGGSATAKQVMEDRRLFNLALRTAYEEMAHAWQGNTQKSIGTSRPVHALHALMWTLAVEAQAKLVTFVALAEHRERGDATPWNSAISGRTTDKAQMDALQKVIDAHPGQKVTDIIRENPVAMCSVFKAFFTDPMPRSLYEDYIADFASRSFSSSPVTDAEFIRERGAFPGVKQNFLAQCGLSINDPGIVKFFDKGAERKIRSALQRAGVDAAKYGLK